MAAVADLGRPGASVATSELLGGRLAVRLTVTTSVLIVVTCLILSVVLVRRHLDEIRRGLVDRGREISGFIARGAELGVLSGDVGALRQFGLVALGLPDVAYCRFFDRDGALLASIGETGSSAGAPPAARSSTDIATVEVNADVSEFQAPIFTTVLRRHRELLLGDVREEGARDQARETIERVGSVSIGMALRRLQDDRRIAFVTAMLFTLLVTILAVFSATFFTRGTLRALASAAQLAEERGRLAELKTSFVTQASHEFRTPLAVILACGTALQRFGSRMTIEQQRKRLAKIQGSVRHMTELLDDVLTLGRTESGKVLCASQPTDLEALCRDAVSDVKEAAGGGRVVLRSAVSLSEATIDPKLVRQILRNLLTNALKYSPAGGTVLLGVTRGDGLITFSVTDEGIGIPAEDLSTIFEPFHRGANVGKIQGSGLGLAITSKAVALHGGTIVVDSAPGRGTTFLVTLPDRPPAGMPSGAASTSR
jgi:signal transduction histidine kinase